MKSASRWVRIISTHGNLRGVAIQAAGLIDQMVGIHGLHGVHAQGLGEAVMGALLMASYCKDGERINLNLQGSGWYQQALVDAYPDGKVRGYVLGREAPISLGEEVGPWGTGLLSVLRSKGEKDQPYIGTVPMITGHLAKDLSFYWVQSEQIPSAVGLSVSMKGDRVVNAGGFLVQALPGAHPEEVLAIEQHINELESLAASLDEDADPLHLLSRIFQSTAFMVIDEMPLRFECNCSWDRVKRALVLVGPAELKDMLTTLGSATVVCDFCAKEYSVDADGLEKLIQAAGGRGATDRER